MPSVSISKNYADGFVLYASDLDVLINSLELFLNTTKIDDTNDTIWNDKFNIKNLIDYGCGDGNSTKGLNIPVVNYDPFVINFKEYPKEPAYMVVCYHVLNCIEPLYFDKVIDELFFLSKQILAIGILFPGNYNISIQDFITSIKKYKFDVIDYGYKKYSLENKSKSKR